MSATSSVVVPRVIPLTVGPLQENSYLVIDPATNAAALIDPGDEGDRLVAMVREAGVDLEAIWLTHAHFDHIGGIAEVVAAFDVPIHVHALDRPLYEMAPRAAASWGLPFAPQPSPDRELVDGQSMPLGTLQFDVIHTPGHAPGHVVIHGHGIALAGDVLFAGSVGRTDLPFCDPRAMTRSLDLVAALPPETIVYPGHGPSTTVGHELATNPFLNGGARVLGG